jgi:hypothetical protein
MSELSSPPITLVLVQSYAKTRLTHADSETNGGEKERDQYLNVSKEESKKSCKADASCCGMVCS